MNNKDVALAARIMERVRAIPASPWRRFLRSQHCACIISAHRAGKFIALAIRGNRLLQLTPKGQTLLSRRESVRLYWRLSGFTDRGWYVDDDDRATRRWMQTLCRP